MSDENDQSKLSRRRFLEAGSAVLVAAAGMQAAQGQQSKIYPTDPHTGINESQPGPKNNTVLDGQNQDSAWPPETDAGGQPPFKYSFSLSHKRVEAGGWTRQVTGRGLPLSKTTAGGDDRLSSRCRRE